MTVGLSTRAVSAPVGVALRNRWGKNPVKYVPLSQFFTSKEPKEGEDDDALYGRRARRRKRARARKGAESPKEAPKAETGKEAQKPTKKPTGATEALDEADSGKSFEPPKDVQKAAARGLELRRQHGRGGLSSKEAGKQGIGSGVQRAVNLKNGDRVSLDTIKRMNAFFSRHQKNKGTPGDTSAGRIAWLLWGGDPGWRWAKSILQKQEESGQPVARLDEGILKRGDSVLMDGMKFLVVKASDIASVLRGVRGRSGQKRGHEGHNFYLYAKGYGSKRRYTLTPATSKGAPGFMASDENRMFASGDVTILKGGQQVAHLDESAAHARSIALMRWLSKQAQELRVGQHVYVVGGAVRNFVIDKPIKDVDVVLDAVALGRGRDSAWFAKQLQKRIGARTSLKTNQYGVAILTVSGDWEVGGHNLKGEVIEIANARSESYGGVAGKGYKPTDVQPAPIEKDVKRREFTFNTLMWRLADLAKGPDKAEIIDLAGCGLRDLKAGSMRCPSDPDKTFSDDPTRMLRAIKFANKYGFKITPDTEASIRRNAGKLRNAPPAAIAKLLVGVILKEPKTAKRALQQMKQLGLLDVVAQMARDDRSFQATLSGWANDQRVGLLFDLLDMGLPVKTKLGAFSAAEQARIRKVTATMPDDRAQAFLAALKQPGRAWKDKLFFAALAAELGATGKTIGELAQRVNGIARDALLAEPRLLDDPAKLKQIVRDAVKGARFEMTLSTNVATTPVPVGAGDGRKFLDFGPGHPYHGRCFDDPECKKKKRKKRRGLSKRLSYLLTIP